MAARVDKTEQRATIVVRQSSTDDVSSSLESQEAKARAYAEAQGWNVGEVHVERSTSGGKVLAKRRGLLAALHTIETGRADVLLVAYGNRLDRNGEVRREVARRVRDADARIVNADTGREVEFETADGFLVNSTEAMLDEHYRLQARERVNPAKRDSIARGVPIARLDRVPLGYSRNAHEPYTVNAETAPLVRRAFELRADGRSVNDVRGMLSEAGVVLGYSAVHEMFSNRVYLGEIAFGAWSNETAHDAIIDSRLFERASSGVKPANGRKAKSERLLARLGVLRCHKCGARFVVASGGRVGAKVPTYRHPPNDDCTDKSSVMAEAVERHVSRIVAVSLAEMNGSAGTNDTAAELERTETALAKATRRVLVLDVPEDEARETLAGLRQARDAARRAHADAEAISGFTVNGRADFPDMGIETRRELISTVLDSVTVRPRVDGDTAPIDRLVVEFSQAFEEQAARVLDEVADAAAEAYGELRVA